MDSIEDIRLADGAVLWAAWAAGIAGLAALLWWSAGSSRPRSRSRRLLRAGTAVAVAALLAAVLVAFGHWLLIDVFAVFPEVLPLDVLAWSVPAVGALLLLILRLRGIWGPPRPARPWRKTAGATAALLGVVLLSAVQINAYFGLNRTVSDLMGTAVARIEPLEDGLKRIPGAAPGVSLAGWAAPAGLPDGGELRRASIPGTESGFVSREAYVYLPTGLPGIAPARTARAGALLGAARGSVRLADGRRAPEPDGPVCASAPRRGAGGGGGGSERFGVGKHHVHGQQDCPG
ncbi:hypothetical protein QFZ65_001569 [Arthrobacter sp. B3I9]|nr:hypothetical protein [Arthrobacter sp. B3I9]